MEDLKERIENLLGEKDEKIEELKEEIKDIKYDRDNYEFFADEMIDYFEEKIKTSSVNNHTYRDIKYFDNLATHIKNYIENLEKVCSNNDLLVPNFNIYGKYEMQLSELSNKIKKDMEQYYIIEPVNIKIFNNDNLSIIENYNSEYIKVKISYDENSFTLEDDDCYGFTLIYKKICNKWTLFKYVDKCFFPNLVSFDEEQNKLLFSNRGKPLNYTRDAIYYDNLEEVYKEFNDILSKRPDFFRMDS